MEKLILLFFFVLFVQVRLFSQQSENLNQLIKTGKYLQAVDLLERDLSVDSNNCEKMFQLTKLYDATYRTEKIPSIFEKINNKCVDNIEYLLAEADYYFEENNLKRTDSILNKIIKLDSTNFLALSKLAKLKIKQNRYNDAIQYYAKMQENDSLNPYFFRKTGYCYHKMDSLQLAEKYYKEALSIDSLEYNSIVLLADLYDQQDRNDELDTLVTYGLKYFSDKSRLLAKKAKVLYLKNKYDDAVPYYQKAIEYGDSTQMNYRQMGISMFMSGLWSPLDLQALERAFAMNKEDYTTAFYLALSYRRGRKYEKAIEMFEKAFEIMIPKQIPVFYVEEAHTYRMMSKFYDADVAYNKALYYQPDRFEVYLDIAVMYEKELNNYEKALKYYERHKKEYTGDDEDTKNYVDSKILKMKEELHFRE